MVPKEIEAAVGRIADAERLARPPGGPMGLVAPPYLRPRALETDHVPRLRRLDPRAEEAAGEPEPPVVPDLGEGPGAPVSVPRAQPADVVLAVERAAARRYAAITVDHCLQPQEEAAHLGPGVREEAVALVRVPLRADDPALLDGQVHLEPARHRPGRLDVVVLWGRRGTPTPCADATKSLR